MSARLWFPCIPGLLLAAACGDEPTPPPAEDTLRTVLVHREDTGENVLLNSNGTGAGSLTPGGTDLIPIGASPVAQLLVLLQGDALVVGVLDRPELDTILRPVPTSMSLATVSDDENRVAIVSYAPTDGIIVFNRANRATDTLPYGPVEPVLPPVFSPSDDRIALFGMTSTAIVVTMLYQNDLTRVETAALGTSRLVNRPLQGWPRWNADGLYLAFLRTTDTAPDTLVVARMTPERPDLGIEERYRAILAPVNNDQPELDPLVNSSTYALTADGGVAALGAAPYVGSDSHAIYLARDGSPRIQIVFSDPAQFLKYPLFIRR